MSTTVPPARKISYKRCKLTGQYNARFENTRRDLLVPGAPDCGEFDYVDSVTVRITPCEEFDAVKGQTVRFGWRVIIFANGTIVHDTGRSDQFSALDEARCYAARVIDSPWVHEMAWIVLMGGNEPSSWAARRVDHDSMMAALDDYYAARDARWQARYGQAS